MGLQLDIENDPIEVEKARPREAGNPSLEMEEDRDECRDTKPTTVAESDTPDTANPSSENKAEKPEYRDTHMVLIDGLEIHEAANILPKMGQEELEKFAADIDPGMKVPIALDEHGKVIDGRNRLRACKLLGRKTVEALTYHLEGDAVVRFIVSQNLHRRQLTESQRADVAAKLAGGLHGGNRRKAQICALTQAEAAKQMGVSERSVQNAKFVHQHGIGPLQTALTQGDIPATTAAELATLPAEEQEQAVTAGPRVVKAKAAEVRRKRARPVSDDVHAETEAEKEERCRKLANFVLKLFHTLPEKYQKRVIRSIAKGNPIRAWLDSAEDDAAWLERTDCTMSFLLTLYSHFVLGLVQRSAWGRRFSSAEMLRKRPRPWDSSWSAMTGHLSSRSLTGSGMKRCVSLCALRPQSPTSAGSATGGRVRIADGG